MTNKSTNGKHVFLSYTRDDTEIAKRIRSALEAAGHIVWQDMTAIKTGGDWIDAIDAGVRAAYAMVTVVSEEAKDSKWVRIEFLHAEKLDKPIFPIKIDDCEIPLMMKDINVTPAHPDFEVGLSKILASLPPPGESDIVPALVSRREFEIRYLDKLNLELERWLESYTPMAGAGKKRRKKKGKHNRHEEIVTAASGIQNIFRKKRAESRQASLEKSKIDEKEYSDILEAVADMGQLVILGDPGAGKTTTLWQIVGDKIEKAKADPQAPLPVLIRLGEMGQHDDLDTAIRTQLETLAPDQLMDEERLFFLLDGLNELPDDKRDENAAAIKALVEACQESDMGVVVTCRELDYTGYLDMGIAEQVHVEPLDPIRIKDFINNYIKMPEGRGDRLFWLLAGEGVEERWQSFKEEVGDFPEVFWLEDTLPEGKEWGYSLSQNRDWNSWVKNRMPEREMLALAQNPYMLYMIVEVYAEEGELPPNRGALFEFFVDFLLEEREYLDKEMMDSLKFKLSNLAYTMQSEVEGTSFSAAQVAEYLNKEDLYRAKSANILSGDETIRFNHQLLQEYFAAYRLQVQMNEQDAISLFPPENWWEAQGWEETVILLAGLHNDDCTKVVKWLKSAQPELAARCIIEGGADCAGITIQGLGALWLPRLTDEMHDPQAGARAAVGRGLGMLRRGEKMLDNRPGVGVNKAGLPDIVWCPVVGTEAFEIRDNRDDVIYTPDVLDFQIAKYPITYRQYKAFTEAEDGFKNPDWWTSLFDSEGYKSSSGEQAFKYDNHPVENVSWYDAVAFCLWFSSKTGQNIRLPAEWEWQWAAQGGAEAREYPFGGWDMAKANMAESDLSRTTAVGMYPSGAAACGAMDMSGNVWEWCLNEYKEPENTDITGSNARVQRGGSWDASGFDASVVNRDRNNPHVRLYDCGFRIVIVEQD